MTIAACYLSTEGVVFGADSTTSFIVPQPGGGTTLRHYNFAQKIFQIGEISTLGVVTWGLGALPDRSYRTLIAQFADARRGGHPLPNMAAVAQEWSNFFWGPYTQSFPVDFARAQALRALPNPNQAEIQELLSLLQRFTVGFCFGGNLHHDRTPCAFEVIFGPDQLAAPQPSALPVGQLRYWGCPNIMERLIYGIDPQLFDAILRSSLWSGTQQNLEQLVQQSILLPAVLLPIREGIDWVHASVYATIKMLSYSQLAPVCGGPVEVAVITADRHFRWIRHKTLDVAIGTGGGEWHTTRRPDW